MICACVILSFQVFPFNPLLYKMSDLSFLAGLMLKLHSGQSWTAEEIASLRVLAPPVITEIKPDVGPDNAVNNESTCKSILEVLQTAPESVSEPPKHEAPKRVKKVKKIEPTVSETPAEVVPVEVPIPISVPEIQVPIQTKIEISAKHCLARMVQKNKIVPGTEDNKLYETKQCIRLKAKGQLLCPKCEEYYTAYKEKAKGKANWEGFINEKPLDHLHIVGSKWFYEHYPGGLDPTAEVALPIPSDPTQETVLAENAPVVEVHWTNIKIGGVNYIYNTEDRRIYRADINKEGEDQILWDDYAGKYINGRIDSFAPENV